MCGRFSLHLTDLAAVASALGVALPQDIDLPTWGPRYNVAPTQLSPIVVAGDSPSLAMSKWGLLPHWAKDASVGARSINARVETADTKPTFRDAWRTRRCVVPATGYFEWKRLDEKTRQPMWIHPSDGSLMRLAGLWSRWHSPGGERIHSFTIITQPATDFVEDIHDRMPIELSREGSTEWLAEHSSTEDVAAVLQRATLGTEHLEARTVGKLVGNPRNDTPECIEAAAPPPPRQQLTFDELFGSDS